MPHPTKKLTKGRRGTRNAHQAIKSKVLSECPKCKKAIKPHHVCKFCGFYNGKEVLKVKTKLDKTKKAKK